MKGRHQTLGVLYLDTSTPAVSLAASRQTGKFTGDHLSLAIAIAHQAALAVEETRYHQAMVDAERLAAVGQTMAALVAPHQEHPAGAEVRRRTGGGGHSGQGQAAYCYKAGRSSARTRARSTISSWTCSPTPRNASRPSSRPTSTPSSATWSNWSARTRPNAACSWQLNLDETLPVVQADPEGIHRALLNIVTNAIDAAEDADEPCIEVSTSRELASEADKGAFVHRAVRDNGAGHRRRSRSATIFRPFVSTKGSRGHRAGPGRQPQGAPRARRRHRGGERGQARAASSRCGCRCAARWPTGSQRGPTSLSSRRQTRIEVNGGPWRA